MTSLSKWWRYDLADSANRKRTHMLVLADYGGSNGSRNRGMSHPLLNLLEQRRLQSLLSSRQAHRCQ